MDDKYWEEIAGQDKVKELLSSFITTDRVPHALLFQGNDGVGKDYISIKFADALNLSFSSNNKAFISKQISNLREPYIKFIHPLPRGRNETEANDPYEKLTADEIDNIREELNKKAVNPYYQISIPNANAIKINSIRDIKKFLSLEFTDLKYRVVIISNAHLMNEPSQNALLKNLEEPPPGVVFILTTSQPSRLRETILSRCWVINFGPLSNEEIVEILTNRFDIKNSLANEAALFSGGSVNKALMLLNNDFTELKEKTIRILRYSFGSKFHSALNELDQFTANNDKEGIKIIIEMLVTWLNDLQRFRHIKSDYFFVDFTETFEKFNKRYPNNEVSHIITKLDQLSSSIQSNVNIKIICLNLVFLLSSIIKDY